MDNPDRSRKPMQLMILWSTKYTDDIQINDVPWASKKLPTRKDGVLRFNGMTAAWWYDGENMWDPILLKETDFEVREGELRPLDNGGDYRFFGSSQSYGVNIVDEQHDFRFELTPWNDYLQKHRFNENYYTGRYSYNIMKIYGMKLRGRIGGKRVTGSGYFQRVNVNAPAMPWYWGLVHCQSGSFIHYFSPFIGPQIFRSKGEQRSMLDWGDISLSRSILFYHRESDTEYSFGKKNIKFSHDIQGNVPVFHIKGEDDEKRIHMVLKAYSRATWRFQQPRRFGLKSVLYYNEYPAILKEFLFEKKDGSLKVNKGELGNTHANFEHTWGKML